jgi:hypothetical protein
VAWKGAVATITELGDERRSARPQLFVSEGGAVIHRNRKRISGSRKNPPTWAAGGGQGILVSRYAYKIRELQR